MIKGSQVILRELRSSDLPSVNRWRNDLKNRIIIQGFRGPVTLEVDTLWLNEILKSKHSNDFYFGIQKPESENIVGIIQLNSVDYISGTAVCGIFIGDTEERGSGLGVDAVRAILYYAFFIQNLRKVIIYIASFNEPALKVAEKVGRVSTEGRLKSHYLFNGEYYDIHILSFFSKDFEFLKNDYSI